jgi:CrcB protein
MWPILLVGIGGFIGSVLRYTVALAAAAAWGETFPWGTILINIVGSFVIGFFGALTLPDGPAPASPDLRLFVMVGICGGFTTFSSFSLQTLTLLRGGAWLGASMNVLASVALCLAAVTMGHALAERSAVWIPPKAASLQTILAVLNRVETAPNVLAVAGQLAARFGQSQIEVLRVRHDAEPGFMPTEEVMVADDAGRVATLRATFDAWQPRHANATWREIGGETRLVVAAESGKSQLVVLGQAGPAFHADAQEAIRAALVDAKIPVVLVPEAPVPAAIGRSIAVAWQRSETADKALAAARPILLNAQHVAILIAREESGRESAPGGLIRRLRSRRITVTVNRFDLDGRDIGEALLQQAKAANADLLVMGAFTHRRFLEALFGGATRDILAQADIPVLLHS